MNSLTLFHPNTSNWFQKELGSPTEVQKEAWPLIAEGKHTLVSAPTGTGKTLSAFLVFIDRLKAQAKEGNLKQELHLIYVSPLKSLASDIRENLKRPLEGIDREEQNSGQLIGTETPALSIAIRTGDTTQGERRQMIKKPPHILITTPESFYLMLTSKSGQSILHTARAIILDELHAMIDSKRGSHLMLSIARLDKLCEKPLQRIGLSATIEPLSSAAKYLSPDLVQIVAPRMHKNIKITITSPLPDRKSGQKDPVWQEVARAVHAHCSNARSIIAFVEGRAYAEKLAYYVNLIAGEGFARTHHGSLSKEQRFEVESALRGGTLRMLVATSSMELGIDVGDIDQVFQIGCPRSIASTMQRLGRAGHNPNRTSIMHIFPRTACESLYSGLTVEVARNGGIEYSKPPRLCLDILAQHLVSMATGEGYQVDEVMELLPRAYPFREVTKEDVKEVLRMLAGDYEHNRNIPVRPRLLYDRINERVEGDPYSRMLAISAGGTIPDKGLYTVKTQTGVKLGELDEEFIFESRVGDRFLLGTFAWQITKIQKDTVLVTPSNTFGARLPFWKGEIKGRGLQTGIAFGTILRRLSVANEVGTLDRELGKLGLDDTAVSEASDFIKRQLAATGILPDDRTIVIEHFRDETGNQQMMVHSIFGRQINSPLAILTLEAAKRYIHTNISYVEDDDGFLLFPYGDEAIVEGLLQQLIVEEARTILEAVLPVTPIFNMSFRYNSAHALMMGVRKTGRVPLWVQRMRSAEMLASLIKYEKHPLIRETKRECLEDYWDLSGLEYVLNGIRSGAIQICELFVDTPSPMSFLLRQQTEAANMYDYSPTPMGIHRASEEALQTAKLIAPSPEQLIKVSERKRLPEDEKQLHSLLMMEGDLLAGELEVPIEWLELLAERGQASYIEPGLWIATEHREFYQSALIEENKEAGVQLLLRLLRYRGPQSVALVQERYFYRKGYIQEILEGLCKDGEAIECDDLYYHALLYDRARKETLRSRREQIKTLPDEHYAAYLANRIYLAAAPSEQLEAVMKLYSDMIYPTALWESILLPSRITRYRPELLDSLLAGGSFFWQLRGEEGLSFHRYEDINWDTDETELLQELKGNERIIYEALYRRGASFLGRLSGLIEEEVPYDVLMRLAEKGFVCADSFLPVRQWLNKEKWSKATVKQRVSARAKAMSSGRWEITHPRKTLSMEEQIERCFDRVLVLSRETVGSLPWSQVLEILRVWEYTGRVRRGYFIEGLSGVQFIRDKEFAAAMTALGQPKHEIIWLSAVDPAQQWGKCLPHRTGRSFLNVPGTAVALRAGLPVVVLERSGKLLRVFDNQYLEEALNSFVLDFIRHRIFHNQNRLIIKDYPAQAALLLSEAGFKRELQDYVLYRS